MKNLSRLFAVVTACAITGLLAASCNRSTDRGLEGALLPDIAATDPELLKDVADKQPGLADAENGEQLINKLTLDRQNLQQCKIAYDALREFTIERDTILSELKQSKRIRYK